MGKADAAIAAAAEIDALWADLPEDDSDPIWWTESGPILPIGKFSKQYLGISLWESQQEDLESFVGASVEDTLRLFTQERPTPYNCGVLAWGKGSGKGYVASIFITWIIYLVLSLKDPHAFLELAPDEAIDIALASPTLKQTRFITFDKVKSRLKKLSWLHNRLRSLGIFDTARFLKKATEAADFIELPNKIRIHNLPLKPSSAEGFNLLVFIIDELAGLESDAMMTTATDLFNTFKSSGQTRFGKAWLGMVTSFPRSTADPQEQLIAAAEEGLFPELFISRRPTWEVHPRRRFEDYADDFKRNPEDSWAKFGAQPRAAVDKYFRSPEAIIRHASGGDISLLRKEFEGTEVQLTMLANLMPDPITERTATGDAELDRYGFPRLKSWFRGKTNVQYVAHIDVGLTRDSAGIAIAHVEETDQGQGTMVLDLVSRWKASQFTEFGQIYRWDWNGQGHYTESVTVAEVDLKTIADFFIWLSRARGFSFESITTDGFNSAQLRQTLFSHDIPSQLYTATKEDYDELKGRIYAKELRYRCDRILYHELSKLVLKNGKVEAPRTKTGGTTVDSHKDEADCAAVVVARLVQMSVDTVQFVEVEPLDDSVMGQLEKGDQIPLAMDEDQLSDVQKKVWDEFFT